MQPSFEKRNELPESSHKRKNRSYYDIFYVSSKTGQTHSFRIHKLLPITLFFIVLFSFISIYFLADYGFKVKSEIENLEVLNYSNMGLKGELESLHKKIKSIETTVGKIDNLSNEIKSVSARKDERKTSVKSAENKDENRDTFLSSGIGPLTKSEFELSKKLSGIKADSLVLKDLFDVINDSELTLGKQLSDVKEFLSTAKKKASALKFVPDLAPTRGRVTSVFGWRISPFSSQRRMHFGVDIAAPVGDPIYVTAQGKVVRVENTEDYGLLVDVAHENSIMTRYAHTSKALVKVGQVVNKGEMIALVGNSGSSTGAHVHYEIEVNGKKTNPQRYIVLW